MGRWSDLVLIETYWNVNQVRKILILGTTSINRNILECKSEVYKSTLDINRVLIETYWNVNSIAGHPSIAGHLVLIETYWNVNYINILSFVETQSVLIETYWNVNVFNNCCLSCKTPY